jgi:two-component system, NarL family, sensor histidine kinase ComP
MFRRQAYYYASAVFLLLMCIYMVGFVQQPYIGLDLKNVNGQWIIMSSDPEGQGYRSGIRVGDLILKINQGDPGKNSNVQRWGEVEGVSTLEIHKLNQFRNQIINGSEFSLLQSTLSDVPFEILGFVFWVLGFLAWMRRPFLAQARSLFWLNWVIGLAFILAPASSRDLLLAKELEIISFTVIPIVLDNFIVLLNSGSRKRVNRFVRHILIVLPVILTIITILQSTEIVRVLNFLRKLVLFTVSIGSLFASWNLGALFMFPNDKPEKNQINILLLGIIIGFLPFILLTAIPIILGLQPILNAHISALFISVIPVTWYYSIVNKYLPDSRRFIGTIISNSVAGVITSFAVSYILLTLKLPRTFNLALYLVGMAFFVVSIAIFSLIRVALNKLLEKYLFSEGKQTFKKRILELSNSVISINEEDSILEEVVKSLKIEGAFIIVEDDKGRYLNKSVGVFSKNISEQLKLEEYFRIEQKIDLEAKMLSDDFLAEVYIPVISDNYVCGMFLGHRYSNVKLEKEELPFITLISSQLAQRLISILVTKELSNEIKDLVKKSFELQRKAKGLRGITAALFRNLERERKSMAHEIHDGPLQFVLDLDRRLKKLEKEVSANDGMLKDVSYMQELVEELSIELRLICKGLRPSALSDLGLLPAIELMCEEIMLNEPIQIFLEIVGISRDDRFNEEVEVAAYRFLQEGISNVVKHSNSNELKIHLEMNESEIELIVRDSGKGFDSSQINDWLLTGVHYGIAGMKERLESLGGELQISSSTGRGTMLRAIIPNG